MMDRQIQELLTDESKLIGTSKDIIEILLGEPESNRPDVWIYIVEHYCYGLLRKRLHLFFFEGKVRDYYIGIL